jgi:hypothetical protein
MQSLETYIKTVLDYEEMTSLKDPEYFISIKMSPFDIQDTERDSDGTSMFDDIDYEEYAEDYDNPENEAD